MVELRLVNPCARRWSDLPATERGRRYCAGCGQHVYDISARTYADAGALLSSLPTACIRYECDEAGDVVFRRPDGQPPGPRVKGGRLLSGFLGASLLVAGCRESGPQPVEAPAPIAPPLTAGATSSSGAPASLLPSRVGLDGGAPQREWLGK
jgi:hypothetical protein